MGVCNEVLFLSTGFISDCPDVTTNAEGVSDERNGLCILYICTYECMHDSGNPSWAYIATMSDEM